MLDKYNHKFSALQYKLTKEVKKNDALKNQSFLVSVDYDVIKTLVLMLTVDELVVKNKIGKYMNTNALKLLEGETKEVLKQSVMILSNKKVGIVEKKVGDKYEIKTNTGEIVTLERSKFILTSSFRDKIVKITKGPYKGRYGEVQDIKMSNTIKNTQNIVLENRIQLITRLQNEYKEEITRLLKTNKEIRSMGIIDGKEFELAMEYRTKEITRLEKIVSGYKDIKQTASHNAKMEKILKKMESGEKITDAEQSFLDASNKQNMRKSEVQYAKQLLEKLRMNLNVKKIIFADELKLIEKYRLDAIQLIKISILNIQNELDGYAKRNYGKNVVVRINAGQKNERNILFSYDEINLNISKVEVEEMLKGLSGKRYNIQFENVYQLIQFLFNNISSILSNDLCNIN